MKVLTKRIRLGIESLFTTDLAALILDRALL